MNEVAVKNGLHKKATNTYTVQKKNVHIHQRRHTITLFQ